MAQLSQLLASVAAGDVGLHAEAVTLPPVQVVQHDLAGLRVVHFLQTAQEENMMSAHIV